MGFASVASCVLECGRVLLSSVERVLCRCTVLSSVERVLCLLVVLLLAVILQVLN